MYFRVYEDRGSIIKGYFVPDGFSSEPHVIVVRDGQVLLTRECDVFIRNAYENRTHATGIIGFEINETHLPGLAGMTDINIADADTGFVFYRRFDPQNHIKERVFRLETHFLPQAELDRSMDPFVQFHVSAAERYGLETIQECFQVPYQSSYVSGRILMRPIEPFIGKERIVVTSLRDPFYELAIRLLTLSQFRKQAFRFLSERDKVIFSPAMDYLNGLDVRNEEQIRKMIRQAPKDILTLFRSPFIHQLLATTPSDTVKRDGVATALDRLSQFALFNANEKDETFATDLAELLDLPTDALRMRPIQPVFADFANILRSIGTLEHVLEEDLILYHFIKQAEKRSLQS